MSDKFWNQYQITKRSFFVKVYTTTLNPDPKHKKHFNPISLNIFPGGLPPYKNINN